MHCTPGKKISRMTRLVYSTSSSTSVLLRRHSAASPDVAKMARFCVFSVACVWWLNASPVAAWRKSPRCNMTTEFECKTGHCIPVDQVCNRHPDCVDGSDESDCHCVQSWLPPMHRCRNKKCVDNFYTCNGKDDCGDGGSDEENCACYGFRCNDGTCILSTWRCDGYKDCKDYSDESNCGALLSGDRRHPFLGLIGPVGCLVAALSIRVLLRSHQRRRLLHSNGETAAAAAAVAAREARLRRARMTAASVDVEVDAVIGTVGGSGGAGGGNRLDDSLDTGNGAGGLTSASSAHWMDRVGAGISSSFAQMRILFNGQQPAGLPPPPPYTETTTLTDLPPAYQRASGSANATNAGIPSVYLLVIPAGKPPPSYNESMSLPDLVQSTGNASQRTNDHLSPIDDENNHFVPVTLEEDSSSRTHPQSATAASFRDESLLRNAATSASSVLAPFALYSVNPPYIPVEGERMLSDRSGNGATAEDDLTSARSQTVDADAAANNSAVLGATAASTEVPVGAVAAAQLDSDEGTRNEEELPPPYEDVFLGGSTIESSVAFDDQLVHDDNYDDDDDDDDTNDVASSLPPSVAQI